MFGSPCVTPHTSPKVQEVRRGPRQAGTWCTAFKRSQIHPKINSSNRGVIPAILMPKTTNFLLQKLCLYKAFYPFDTYFLSLICTLYNFQCFFLQNSVRRIIENMQSFVLIDFFMNKIF